jgi:hypothetical protein
MSTGLLIVFAAQAKNASRLLSSSCFPAFLDVLAQLLINKGDKAE